MQRVERRWWRPRSCFPLLISLFSRHFRVLGEALTVSRRVEAAAGTGADLVARVRTIYQCRSRSDQADAR